MLAVLKEKCAGHSSITRFIREFQVFNIINYKKYPDIVEKVIKLLKILASSVLLSRIINIDEAALFIAPKKI